MKCLFFDHSFHKQTRSSDFFVSLISGLYDVDVAYIDPSTNEISSSLVTKGKECDLVVFWQIIPSLHILSSFDRSKVLLIPMYDACCILSFKWWISYKQYRFVSFSRKLHNYFLSIGIESFYLQYVPEIPLIEECKKDVFPTIFIWKRTPNLNLKKLLGILQKNGIKKAICHGFNEYDKNFKCDIILEYTNGWFKDHYEYLKTLSRCHYFFAPRQFEGIGMGFLEAMGLGLCVIAPNESTMNEYINGKNGVLFNSISDICFEIDEYEKMSLCARKSFDNYKIQWEGIISAIYPFIQSKDVVSNTNGISWKPIIKEEFYKLFHIRIRNYVRRHFGIQDY